MLGIIFNKLKLFILTGGGYLFASVFSIVMSLIYLHQFSYNSDDVAEQTISHSIINHGLHGIYLPPDPWLLKYPFYVLIESIFSTSRKTILLESIVMNVLLVVLLFIALKFLYKKILISKSKLTVTQSYIWLLWVFTLTPGFVSFIRQPNTRNFELGILILVVLIIYYVYSSKSKINHQNLILACLTILSGICFYSDQYFLVFLVTFLGSFMFFELIKKKLKYNKVFAPMIVLIGGIVIYALIQILLNAAGFHVAKLQTQVVGLHALNVRLLLVWRGWVYMFSVSLPSIRFEFISKAIELANILLSLLGLLAASFLVFRKKSTSFERAIGLQPAFVILAFIISVSVNSVATARYLVLAVLYLIIVFPIALMYMKPKIRNLLTYFVIFLAIVNIVCTTTGTALVAKGRNPLLNTSIKSVNPALANVVGYNDPRNERELNIIQILKANNLTKGYSDYWNSLIVNYLSDYKITIGQVLCNQSGTVRPYYWVVDDNTFNPTPNTKSFFLFEAPNINHVACNLKVFGPYSRAIVIDKRTVIFIYNYDVASKFPPESSLSKPD